MTALRLYALFKGDLSRAFIHPAMVHTANLFGFLLWQVQSTQFSLGTEEYLRLLAEESVALMETEPDETIPNPVASRVQVYCTLAGYHFYGKRVDACREYLSRAAGVIERAGTATLVRQAMEAKFDHSQVEAGPYLEARNAEEGE
jgi:hypothetical protein